MTTDIRRICVIGPECSGKTTLAANLAEWMGTEWVPEAARSYAKRVGRALTVADYEPIAREHIALADGAAARVRAAAGNAVVLDTDLVSTIVYARHYYDETTKWLEREAQARLADVYLLCDVDIPWVADGIRDRPHGRREMFRLFSMELIRQQARAVVVTGDRLARWQAAQAAVTMLPENRG